MVRELARMQGEVDFVPTTSGVHGTSGKGHETWFRKKGNKKEKKANKRGGAGENPATARIMQTREKVWERPGGGARGGGSEVQAETLSNLGQAGHGADLDTIHPAAAVIQSRKSEKGKRQKARPRPSQIRGGGGNGSSSPEALYGENRGDRSRQVGKGNEKPGYWWFVLIIEGG